MLCALMVSVRAGADDHLVRNRVMEQLDRGLVAVPAQDQTLFVSWRLLAEDPEGIAFDLFRVRGEEPAVKVNTAPISGATCFIDTAPGEARPLAYYVQPVAAGEVPAPAPKVEVWPEAYLEIPIQPIPDYRPGDASAADLDGDGQWEIVLHQTSRGRDNSHAGVTGTPVLDAYELDGTHLWRIDLGVNIREGEHYTQFMVYDLDGDGKAEVACKTADGSKDGLGNIIGDPSKDWRNVDERSRSFGRILDGPEFLTIFDGRTGAALATTDYVPPRDPIDGWGGIGGNGGNDDYGNRCDRFLACVAYLDGRLPSLVMCRGVYGRTVLVAWDWRENRLSRRWVFDSGISDPPYEDASPFSGMGGHSLAVADVDADGRDEIVYHAMTVDDDGTGLYSTGRRHGDAMYLGDFDPERPGLELFLITENEDQTVRFQTPGAGMHDARTGELLWSHSPGVDVGAGLVADIDPRYPGWEAWGGPGGLRTARGEEIGPSPRNTQWAIWWDGDLLRELLSGGSVMKWNWQAGREELLFATGIRWGGRPSLTADLLGDWREELLIPAPDGRSLRLYTTTIPTEHRIVTMMQDPQYRLSVAWQNVVYNKPASGNLRPVPPSGLQGGQAP